MVRIVILRLLESFFRHRWLNIIPILIAAIVGVIFVLNMAPEYVATGRLYVSQENLLADLTSSGQSGSFWTTAAETTVSEMYELISTQAFIRTVIQKTDLEASMALGPDSVYETMTYARKVISIQAVGSNLLDISATGDDPTIVYQLVASTMDAYVQWKINNGYQESVAARSFFEALMVPYQEDVDNARNDLIDFLDANPNPVRGDRPPEETMELERLQASVQRAEERLSAARDNLENASLSQVQSESVTKQTYMVIDQPEIPQVAEISTKTMIMNFAIFVVVGIFLSVVGIAGGALLDRSLRFPIDVRHGLSLPVLAMVPMAKPILVAVPAEVGVNSIATLVATEEATLQPQT
ncbi:lipopolysaccharide biosynthesis protein [Candidatus Oscillochloris fontis]|uniref:lipopolysaccharide biosynthesis protein n=1 Tax=Candidatus Oscillochloris fontis TaxID=2496868 RepID=UPI00101C3C81|nr:lipopolysaccharide biosynthesis protein [Candidatus Oscillochloris fontis]